MGQEETFWAELLYRGRPGGEKNPEAGFPERWLTQMEHLLLLSQKMGLEGKIAGVG